MNLISVFALACCGVIAQPLTGQNKDEKIQNESDPSDLGIRFNKFGAPVKFTLRAKDYPLKQRIVQTLRKSTLADSVVVPSDCKKSRCSIPPQRLIRLIGGRPTFPTNNPRGKYWKELEEVVRVQHQRWNGDDPAFTVPLPTIFAGYDMDFLAEAVHDEFPGVNHVKLIESFLSEGAAIDRKIVNSKSRHDFLREEILLAEINTWAISLVGPHNFSVKWHVGRPRPEEVAWKIANGMLTPKQGVPKSLIEAVNYLELDNSTSFTAYPEGSPFHPSWPAMHSAGASASLWLAVVMNLTPSQLCEVKKLDYTVSYARTIAGVHYTSDNIAGLDLGQEVLARRLPRYLKQRFGSDPKLVRRKIAKFRFKWNRFLKTKCARNGLKKKPPSKLGKVEAIAALPFPSIPNLGPGSLSSATTSGAGSSTVQTNSGSSNAVINGL